MSCLDWFCWSDFFFHTRSHVCYIIGSICYFLFYFCVFYNVHIQYCSVCMPARYNRSEVRMNHCEKVSGWQERERNWHGQYKLRLFSTPFFYIAIYVYPTIFCAYVVSAKVDFDLLLMCFFPPSFFLSILSSCLVPFYFVKFRKKFFFLFLRDFRSNMFCCLGHYYFIMIIDCVYFYICHELWCNHWYDWLDDRLTFDLFDVLWKIYLRFNI